MEPHRRADAEDSPSESSPEAGRVDVARHGIVHGEEFGAVDAERPSGLFGAFDGDVEALAAEPEAALCVEAALSERVVECVGDGLSEA